MADEIQWKLTNEIRFVPRLENGRYIRVLQQKRELDGTFEWVDVQFEDDEEYTKNHVVIR